MKTPAWTESLSTEQGKQKTGKLRGSQVVGEERVAKQSGKVASVGDGIAMVDEFATHH